MDSAIEVNRPDGLVKITWTAIKDAGPEKLQIIFGPDVLKNYLILVSFF